MNELKKAFNIFIPWLEKRNISYMVFGGLAVSVYGSPRQTFDIDIKLSIPTQVKRDQFVSDLKETARILPDKPLKFIKETGVLPVEVQKVRIDLVFAELPFEFKAVNRSIPTRMFDLEVRVCTAEDLIIHKAISVRKRDWLDIESVITQQYEHLDWDYIIDNCQELADFLDRPSILQKIEDLRDEHKI
jgi:hypothetical protein